MFETFKKFLSKYASEALSIGDALTTVLDGLAIKPSDAAIIKATIAKLEAANVSILGSVETMSAPPEVKISKRDIQDAVKTVLQPMVDEAVAKALAK